MTRNVVRSSVVLVVTVVLSSCSEPPSGDTVADYFAPPDAYPGPTWQRDGADVANSEINSIAGPEHCEWQDAVLMHIGWPLGTRASDARRARQFIRDPEGVIDPAAAKMSLQVAQLPVDAQDTRYRLGDLEVWSSPSESQAIYLRVGADVERWPRVDPPTGCA